MRYDDPQCTKISPGWLSTDTFINKITISRGTVIEIEPDAFNNCTLRRLTELVIERTQITCLRTGVFEGANNLKTLTLEGNEDLQLIEKYTFDSLYQLEEVRMVEHPKLGSLQNFTGISQFNLLRTLTLSSNNFGESINAGTFKGCSQVEALNLANSSIKVIPPGTFNPMINTLRFLDLSNNQIKHLPGELFRIGQSAQIFLANIPWVCDCSSLELQMWYKNSSDLIVDAPLYCDMPPLEHGKEVLDVDLSNCDDYTSVAPPPPERPSTTANTLDTTQTTVAVSTSAPPSSFTHPLECSNDKYALGYLYLEKVYQYFSVTKVGTGKVSVEISSPDSSLSMIVTNNKDEACCRYNINRQMTFDGLDESAVYVFCLIKKTSSGTSPKNCLPFHFESTTSIWGHDEVIIALVCSIVLSLIVGILCGWLLSCKYKRTFKRRESLQYQSSGRSPSKTVTEFEDFGSYVAPDYFAGKYGSDFGSNGNRLR